MAASEAWRETGRSSHVNTLCWRTQRYIVDGQWDSNACLPVPCVYICVRKRDRAMGLIFLIAIWEHPTIRTRPFVGHILKGWHYGAVGVVSNTDANTNFTIL